MDKCLLLVLMSQDHDEAKELAGFIYFSFRAEILNFHMKLYRKDKSMESLSHTAGLDVSSGY
jgi:hypothetical protein